MTTMTTMTEELVEIPTHIQAFFLIALSSWIVAYAHCYINLGGKQAFSKTLVLHDFHAVGCCVLASMSIYFNDEKIFSELIPLSFTLAYFVVDLTDCIIRRDIPFFIHAILSVLLSVGCGLNPLHRSCRSCSRGALTELSTYNLHKWQNTKSKSDFIIFFVMFTACRIIWIPYFVWHVYLVSGFDYQVMGGICIFFLNLFWWFRMIQILSKYEDRSKHLDSDVEKEQWD